MRFLLPILSSALLWSFANAQEPSTPGEVKPGGAVLQKNVQQISAPPSQVAQKVTPSGANPSTNKSADISVAKALLSESSTTNEQENTTNEFPVTIKRLYCISQIKGATDSLEIQHRWYWNDNLVATVPLMIRSANWRTYSAKTILPAMTGDWRVAIVNGQKDEVLHTIKFTVK